MKLGKYWRLLIFAALISLTLTACDGAGPGGQSSVSTSGVEGVFGGEVLNEHAPIVSYLVGINYRVDSDNIGRCTGTLFMDRIVLTAAHCVGKDVKDIEVFFIRDMDQVDRAPKERRRKVLRAEIHPEYESQQESSNGPNRYDVAVLLLDSPAPKGTHHMEVLDVLVPQEKFGSSLVAGYGAESYFWIEGEERSPDKKLRIARVPRLKSDVEGIIILDQTQGSGVCSGDSGGPAFIEKGDGFVLIGIASSVNSETEDACRGRSFYVSVSDVSSWIFKIAIRLQQNL